MFDISRYCDVDGILLINKVLESGISKTTLYRSLKENRFIKVSKGVYAHPEAWVDENYIISLRYSDAIFSHDEALNFYRLIDREPMEKTLTLYSGYGTKRLVDEGICVFTVKRELLEIGKRIVVDSYGHYIPIYDLERTMIDMFRNRSRYDIHDFQTALRTYIARKDKNLHNLMEYAKLFRVYTKVKEYMEVLL